MPELPEVETVRSGLARAITGRHVDAVRVLHPRPVRRHELGPDAFAAALAGRTFGAAASTSGCPSTTVTPCSPTWV